MFIKGSLNISELRTLEAPEPLRGVTAEVCEEVRPVTGVTRLVPGQAEGDRNIRVLCLARHLQTDRTVITFGFIS